MIDLQNVTFGYPKGENLFSDLSLGIKSGGICGLLGKNGAGKTTLLKIIAGLVFPKQGTCEVLGCTPKHRQPDFLQEVFFLPEDLYVPPLLTSQYLDFYAPFYHRFDRDQFANYLKEFEIPSDKSLQTLSYGQKKKLLLAFGLATNCRIFILDEPTNGLDIPSKAQFRQLLAAAISTDRIFIVSTHQVHDIENLIDSVVILDDGKIIFHADLMEISKHLLFQIQQSEPEKGSCIYYEKHLAGYTVVAPNNTNQDSNIDLETLFNAILSNKTQIQQLFARGNT